MAGIRFTEVRASITDDYGHRLTLDWDGTRLVLAVHPEPGDELVTVPVVALGRADANTLADLLEQILTVGED
jgi:hypothetical protein